MKIDKSKDRRQGLAAERWRKSAAYGSYANGCGTLWFPTGFGKTYTACNKIVKPVAKKTPTTSTIVLVHREKLEKQWNTAVEKFVPEANVKITTVQALIASGEKPSCDLLIVDEVHKFYEDTFFSYVDGTNIKYKYILCLTATYIDPHKRHLKLDAVAPVIDQITEQEALLNGWISKYIEYNLGIDLTNIEIIKYQKISQDIADNMSKFGDYGFKGANLVLRGDDQYEGFKYAMMWAKTNGWNQSDPECMWNPNRIIGYAKELMKGIRDRKQMLYESPTKLAVVREIIEKFDTLKIMSFSESTAFAERLNSALNLKKEVSVVYHSQVSSQTVKDKNGNYYLYKSGAKKGKRKVFGKKMLKKLFTEKFLNNEVRVLSTARALDEGFDDPSIQMGIISSRSSNFNQHTQRGGRIKRVLPSDPSSTMIIINVYFKMTKDADWLRKAQSKSTNKIYWVSSVDEISFDPDDGFDLDDL